MYDFLLMNNSNYGHLSGNVLERGRVMYRSKIAEFISQDNFSPCRRVMAAAAIQSTNTVKSFDKDIIKKHV